MNQKSTQEGAGNVLKVFYSWQSDLPSANNRGAIEKALKAASQQFQQKPGWPTVAVELAGRKPDGPDEVAVSMKVDQAAKGLPGSPRIPDAIIQKIQASDVFIADISTVNGGSRRYRRTPNPNVMFELGYAAAVLGWERVLLVMNIAGQRRSEIPFDIQGHLYFPYDLASDTSDRKAVIQKLGGLLASSISLIGVTNPPRPTELRGKTKAQLQREHDVRMMSAVLSTLSLPLLQDHLDAAPDYFKFATAMLKDEFDAVYRAVGFYLHDAKLEALVKSFAHAFARSIPGDATSYYREMPDPCTERFVNDVEAIRQGVSDLSEAARKQLTGGVADLRVALTELLSYVRDSFPELDVDELGRSITSDIKARVREIRRARKEA